ncbi:MAG: MmgE/PrpD family protein [Pseudomonadota bacterium]
MSHAFDHIADFIEHPVVPTRAREMAALLLIDTLGVAAAARDLAPARMARNHSVAFHAASAPKNAAHLLFDGRTASIPGAAFAAATQIDNLDGHDGYNPTKGHIGCAVVPALLAFGEGLPELEATAALDTLVMSYEIGARAAIALHGTVSDYHTSGAWNGIAVAAIGCRLRNAPRTALREALGIAEYHGPRSQMMREIDSPTMLHDGSGMGALTGAMAALLALDGFEGAPAITLEATDVAEVWSDLGSRWTILENYIKPYPVCRWAHAPLDGLSHLMKHNRVSSKDIERISVRTFAESAALFPGVPDTTSKAQYSLVFAMAAMMAYGQVGPAQISGEGLTDNRVIALMPRIEVVEAEVYSKQFPAQRCADVSVHLKDGRVLLSGEVDARGGPEDPMSLTEVEGKLRLFADPAIGEHAAKQLWAFRAALLEDKRAFRQLSDFVTQPFSQTAT